MAHLTDAQLQAKTSDFKLQVKHGKDLDVLLPEAYAVVREASKRVINMRHYDVQLVSLLGILLASPSVHCWHLPQILCDLTRAAVCRLAAWPCMKETSLR